MVVRPRLRVLTASWPGRIEPWRARFIRDLHLDLADRFDTEVIAPRVHGEDPIEEQDGPLQVNRFPYRSKGKSPRQGGVGMVSAFSWLRGIDREAKRWSPLSTPAAILNHWAVPAAPVARKTARRLDCPYIVWCHGSDIHRHGRTRIGAYLLRRGLKDADRVLAASEEMARELLERHGICGVQVLPVGIDPIFIETPVPPSAAAPLKLLWVGERLESKGYSRVLEALLKATRAGTRPSLEVIGGGPGNRLEEPCRSECDIELRGPRSPQEVLEAMDRSHLLLLPSHGEGTPLVVQEAMARNLPVLATPVGGIPALFEGDGDWFPVDGDDDAAIVTNLTRWITSLCADPAPVEEARRRLACRGDRDSSRTRCADSLARIIEEVMR